MKNEKKTLEDLDFGKNSSGEPYDCNIHIRICLNADRVKKAGMTKANAV